MYQLYLANLTSLSSCMGPADKLLHQTYNQRIEVHIHKSHCKHSMNGQDTMCPGKPTSPIEMFPNEKYQNKLQVQNLKG